jgi:hypothetical protein
MPAELRECEVSKQGGRNPHTVVHQKCIYSEQYQVEIKPYGIPDEVCKDVFDFLYGELIRSLAYVKVLGYTGGNKWSSMELVCCCVHGAADDCGCEKSKTTIKYVEGTFVLQMNNPSLTSTIKSPRNTHWNSLRKQLWHSEA